MGCEDGMGGERGGPVSYEGPKKLPEWKGGSQCLRCALHHVWRVRPHEGCLVKAEKSFHGGLWPEGTEQGMGSLERLCGLRWQEGGEGRAMEEGEWSERNCGKWRDRSRKCNGVVQFCKRMRGPCRGE